MTVERSRRQWNRLEYDERHEQILSTARALFSERPYGDVSTIEIAEAAGVTRGLLHHYFGTKRALYLEVVKDLVGSPVLDLFDTINLDDDEALTARGWEHSVDLWMKVVEANKDAWLIAISAGETGQDHAMHEILEHARERTAAQVIQVLGIDEKQLPEVRSVVRGYASLAEEITREWLQRKRLTREQARIILVGSLPNMIDTLLPKIVEERGPQPTAGAGRPRSRGSKKTA